MQKGVIDFRRLKDYYGQGYTGRGHPQDGFYIVSSRGGVTDVQEYMSSYLGHGEDSFDDERLLRSAYIDGNNYKFVTSNEAQLRQQILQQAEYQGFYDSADAFINGEPIIMPTYFGIQDVAWNVFDGELSVDSYVQGAWANPRLQQQCVDSFTYQLAERFNNPQSTTQGMAAAKGYDVLAKRYIGHIDKPYDQFREVLMLNGAFSYVTTFFEEETAQGALTDDPKKINMDMAAAIMSQIEADSEALQPHHVETVNALINYLRDNTISVDLSVQPIEVEQGFKRSDYVLKELQDYRESNMMPMKVDSPFSRQVGQNNQESRFVTDNRDEKPNEFLTIEELEERARDIQEQLALARQEEKGGVSSDLRSGVGSEVGANGSAARQQDVDTGDTIGLFQPDMEFGEEPISQEEVYDYEMAEKRARENMQPTRQSSTRQTARNDGPEL